MSTITALVVINDTVVEETFTAERITCQRFGKGRVQIKLWSGGQVVQYVSYRRCEKFHRVDADLALVPRQEQA